MFRIARAAAPLLALLIVTGCAAFRDSPGAPGTVVINNDSPMTINVYALRLDTRLRLGTVPGLSTREFELRPGMLGPGNELQVLIAPVGSARTYRSDRIFISDGDVIELRVSGFIR